MVRSKQHGVTLTGLIVALAVIGLVLVFAMRMIPAYIEYNAIKTAIVKTKAEGGTVRAMQAAFDRNTSINDVEAIRGADLVFTRDDGDLEISFAYEKRLPLASTAAP
jgi:Tfp pilus assembly protein PilE